MSSTGSRSPSVVGRGRGTMLTTTSLSLLLILLTVHIQLINACFITNCPIGGKRALPSSPLNTQLHQQPRQCMSCGPEGLGQCYGPDICCGESIGCFMRTAESQACAHENEVPVPCEVRGSPCGEGRNGRCGTDGVCCNDKYCQIDSECKESREERQKVLNKAFMAVLKDVMRQRARGGASQQQLPLA